jgi:hypothetical protein
MGFFHSIGHAVSNVVHSAVQVVTAPVAAVSNIAHGQNVLGSVVGGVKQAGSGAIGVYAGTSGVGLANNATGGLFSTVARNIPIIGDPLANSANYATALSSGQTSLKNVYGYGYNSLKFGTEVTAGYLGGAAVAGAVGASSLGGAAATAGETLGGLGATAGEISGAVGAAGGLGAALGFGGGGSSENPVSKSVEDASRTIAGVAPSQSISTTEILIVAGIAIGAIYFYRRK